MQIRRASAPIGQSPGHKRPKVGPDSPSSPQTGTGGDPVQPAGNGPPGLNPVAPPAVTGGAMTDGQVAELTTSIVKSTKPSQAPAQSSAAALPQLPTPSPALAHTPPSRLCQGYLFQSHYWHRPLSGQLFLSCTGIAKRQAYFVKRICNTLSAGR